VRLTKTEEDSRVKHIASGNLGYRQLNKHNKTFYDICVYLLPKRPYLVKIKVQSNYLMVENLIKRLNSQHATIDLCQYFIIRATEWDICDTPSY